MKALILAAGEGTRLRPLTSNIPKPLLLVAGKPYLSHLLSSLRAAGITDVALLVGFKSNRIRERYGDGSSEGINITYLEQKVRLGTANAIGVAEEIMNEDFVCINGDVVLSEKDIIDIVHAHRQRPGTIMSTVAVQDPSRFGVIEESEGKMLRILEKPTVAPSNLINAGLFIFTPQVFQYIRKTKKSPRGEYEITDTLNMMACDIDISIFKLKGPWMDVGRAWDLLKANEILMANIDRRIEGVVEEGATLIGNVVVEKGARVRSGSYIEGPVYISAGCDIGPNCYIRPSTCLGKNVRVGAAVEVKNSIVMDGTHIPHQNYVGDSIIGERCNFGAGTKVANLRFDNKLVKVSFNGELIDVGTRKLGVIMGDDVKTGINSMIEPGTIIGEKSYLGMGALAKGEIGPNSRIF
jgi:UDP-N-acetylglucosamine diphosphorylase / glucose-1-phosphate thymidylyltransferase / UDP-N-acetylgalactosamine diphosphorylase / glucosamine-1-phosphate N-acetyltransferase / galactosamine-1-phosphate N-acetyltransferase